MRGGKGDNRRIGSSGENACFALWVVGWPGLRGDGDLDC